jgi:hypothetical protein
LLFFRNRENACFYGVFWGVLNFFRWLFSNETPFFLVFEKAASRFLESFAVFWAELLPMVFFPQVAGGIACTGFVAENANRYRPILPISGYQWLLVFLQNSPRPLGEGLGVRAFSI